MHRDYFDRVESETENSVQLRRVLDRWRDTQACVLFVLNTCGCVGTAVWLIQRRTRRNYRNPSVWYWECECADTAA